MMAPGVKTNCCYCRKLKPITHFVALNFHATSPERLNDFPRHIARGAMSILGRLGGGDPAAFNGAKCIKGVPTVVRQRIGLDFRLLFRLLPDRIEVIDLIPVKTSNDGSRPSSNEIKRVPKK